jgi:hypothetical protein
MLRILPFRFALSTVLNSTDNVLKISHTDGMFLTQWMAIGDHTYLILQDGRGWEVVKYTHSSPLSPIGGVDILPIDRAQHGTVRRSWPVGQCLVGDRNEGTLREFDLQNAG